MPNNYEPEVWYELAHDESCDCRACAPTGWVGWVLVRSSEQAKGRERPTVGEAMASLKKIHDHAYGRRPHRMSALHDWHVEATKQHPHTVRWPARTVNGLTFPEEIREVTLPRVRIVVAQRVYGHFTPDQKKQAFEMFDASPEGKALAEEHAKATHLVHDGSAKTKEITVKVRNEDGTFRDQKALTLDGEPGGKEEPYAGTPGAIADHAELAGLWIVKRIYDSLEIGENEPALERLKDHHAEPAKLHAHRKNFFVKAEAAS